MTDAAKPPTPRRGATSGSRARTIRELHFYLGMLIAPSVLFFALTGAIQLFGLHEVREGRAFQPPAWMQSLGKLHKDQTLALERPDHHDDAKPDAPAGGADPDHAGGQADHHGGEHADHHDHGPPATPLKTLALKWVFLAVALGLASSTGLGVWMGLTQGRRRRLALGLLIAGAAIPLLLLAL